MIHPSCSAKIPYSPLPPSCILYSSISLKPNPHPTSHYFTSFLALTHRGRRGLVNPLHLSLSFHFHIHNSAIVATLVVFFAVLVVHFTGGCRHLPTEVDRSRSEGVEADQKIKGLDAPTISSLPTFLTLGGGRECSICLGVFEENDEMKAVPKCNHVYHLECLGIWLNSHGSCPLCRQPLMFKSGSRNFSALIFNTREARSEEVSKQKCLTCATEDKLVERIFFHCPLAH